MSAPTSKFCAGAPDVIQLAPMRMADLMQQQKPAPLTGIKKTGYVLPHMRKTAPSSDTPKTLASIDTSSAADFPTLGSTPRSTKGGPASASWTQIRNRFQTPAADTPPATPATTVTSATNQFAALDDDAAATPKSPGAINFKQVIKDRIKREDAERRGTLQEEPTDPQLMTREQLVRNGWAVLSLPPPSSARDARATWFAEYVKRAVAKEATRDREFEALCEIYAPAGTVEPELRSSRLAVDLDTEQESVGYESEPDEDRMHEVEAY